jgi:hypothetical protein
MANGSENHQRNENNGINQWQSAMKYGVSASIMASA